jgi:hypothetical protein
VDRPREILSFLLDSLCRARSAGTVQRPPAEVMGDTYRWGRCALSPDTSSTCGLYRPEPIANTVDDQAGRGRQAAAIPR